MNKLKKYLLKDIADTQTGPFGTQLHKEDYVSEGTPMVTVEHLGETGFILNNLPLVSDSDKSRLSKYILKQGDIVFSRVGSVDRCTYVSEREDGWLFSGRCLRVRFNDKANAKYVSYYFRQKFFKEMMLNISVGATMPSLNTSLMANIPLYLPNKETQTISASILSSLDNKIELNNRINAELEQMAKTIYDYWFVQFDFPISAEYAASVGQPELEGKPYKSSGGKMVWSDELKREVPDGWEVKKLEELGNFKNGVNYDPSNPGEIACPIINVRNISASTFFIKNEDLDIIYLRKSDVRKYAVHEGSIIIARSGIPGATRLISDIEINTLYCGFAIQYELNNLEFKIPAFFYLKSIEFQIQNGSGGTILKNVNQATLNALQVVLPKDKNTLMKFNELIRPIFSKMNIIMKENQKLTELRDWLLPMLMNGQVRVGDVEDDIVMGMAVEPVGEYKVRGKWD